MITPESRLISLTGADPDLLRRHLESIHQNIEAIKDHNPGFGYGYWKALGLAKLAVHLSGGTVWHIGSLTGGVSVMKGNRLVAQNYLNIITERWLFEAYGMEGGHMDRILVGFDSRVSEHASKPTHQGAEVGEVILRSMHLDHMDPASQGLIISIFGSPPALNEEMVRV